MILRRIFKGFAFIFLTLILLFSCFISYLFISPSAHIDSKKLTTNSPTIIFLTASGKQIATPLSLNEKVEVDKLPDFVIDAFVAVEDKRFFKHNGVDMIGMMRAFKNNLFSRSIKEGGSTITQQLIKNSHLSSERTFARKLKEIRLALKMERLYSKNEILSFYLNGIYFGEGAYGIERASLNYFGKSAKDLSLVEACALASTVKAPSLYNPRKDKCEERKNLVLKLMHEQGYISNEEYRDAVKTAVETQKAVKESDYAVACLDELYDKEIISPYEKGKIKVVTYCDEACQKALECTLEKNNQGGIIMNKRGEILGYKMSEGDFERPPASTIKPLIVYAPAIDEGVVHLATKILDEPCTFSDYTPSNYGNKYYGWVSVKDCLLKSLNVPAVKLLDAIGSKKARLYARKLNIEINEEGLGIALGSYNGGVDFKTLCAAYTPFLSQGNYFNYTFIHKAFIDEKCVYEHEEAGDQVFSAGCVEIINDALMECAISGTAKAIGLRDYEVAAKTGTVGNDKGNTDAYTICYTSEHIIGVRFCNKDNSLMPNEITGGYVAKYASALLDEIYANNRPSAFLRSNEVVYADMCALAYEEGALALSDKTLSNKYIFTTPILSKYLKSLPISSFSTPSVACEIENNQSDVIINFEKNERTKVKIERGINGDFELIKVTDECFFVDEELDDGKYIYKITPFFVDSNGNEIIGKEVILPEIFIYNEESFKNSPWWEND